MKKKKEKETSVRSIDYKIYYLICAYEFIKQTNKLPQFTDDWTNKLNTLTQTQINRSFDRSITRRIIYSSTLTAIFVLSLAMCP